MSDRLRPLAALDAGAVRALFTDVDGTLTTGGQILPSTYAALWRWKEAGRALVLVTGRPAGWADAMVRLFPVDAVISENGGATFLRRGERIERHYAASETELKTQRKRMLAAAREVARKVPGARLSSDSRYTEVDLAIDWHEDVALSKEAAGRIESLLRRRGFSAVRSSVHVNFWAGGFDKLVACRALLKRLKLRESAAVYVGDSVNDAPMFGGFTNSVGVANVRDVLSELEHLPAFVTRKREGRGFEEVVRRLLR